MKKKGLLPGEEAISSINGKGKRSEGKKFE